jgi:lipoprotein-releasing system permease protein
MSADPGRVTYGATPSSARRLALALAGRMLMHGENRFARFVTWVSFFGLALGVMVLTVVITVMNGFDGELKSRLLRSIPHVTIADASTGDQIYEDAQTIPEVASVHTYFQGLGAISVASEVQPVSLYGISSDGVASLSYLADTMHQGSLADLADNPNGLILGAPLARYLRLSPGDTVVVMAVQNSADGVAPKLMRFTLVGTFELGAEPDYSLAIINLQRQSTASWQAMGTRGLQIQLHNPMDAQRVARTLQKMVPQSEVDSWNSAYGELFDAVRLEKSMMFLLLLLVVAIASFNIIAGQTMMVNDKRASIAILRTMGGNEKLIRRIFLFQGVCIGVMGTLVGLLLGLLSAYNINAILNALQGFTGMHLLDGSFFVEVPVLVLPVDLLIIAIMSCGLCLLSAWFPARRAASLDPVQALH